MSYLNFLLIFIAPPIVLLAFLQRKPIPEVTGKRMYWALPLVCLIAFIYTTPWDNYLVYKEVWGYGTERVLGTLFYVPYEEYAFFLLQPIMTGLLFYTFLRNAKPKLFHGGSSFVVGLVFYLAITALGFYLLWRGGDQGLYMGLILAWSGPVLLGMWAYGGRLFWRYRTPALITLSLSTIYLWWADRTAIALNIWNISDRFSFNFDPFGLPIEEAVFFLVTNILVIQGTLLFLFGDQIGPGQPRSD